jgi:hypothetical protein
MLPGGKLCGRKVNLMKKKIASSTQNKISKIVILNI